MTEETGFPESGGELDLGLPPRQPSPPSVLGDRAEWLCSKCRTVHPHRLGEFLSVPCPDCGEPMAPSSPNVREIARLREELRQVTTACDVHHRTAARDRVLLDRVRKAAYQGGQNGESVRHEIICIFEDAR